MAREVSMLSYRRGALRVAAAAALVLCVIGAAGRAAAQGDANAARTAFDQGVAAFAKENYTASLEAFVRSYSLNPKASVLFNIAMCRKALFLYVDSLATFRKYLTDGASKVTPERRAEVEQAIAEMERLIGGVVITGAPVGARVSIDGAERGAAPFTRPLPADPGKHIVEVRCDGYEPMRADIAVASGAETTVQAELEKAAVMSATAVTQPATANVGDAATAEHGAQPEVPAPVDDGERKRRLLLGVGGVAALALGAAGVGVGGYFTHEGSKDAKEGADAADAGDAGGRSAAVDDLGKDRAGVIAGFAIGGALLVTGVVLLIVRARERDEGSSSDGTTAVRPGAFGVEVVF
jgi:hypothetical protein